MLTERVVEIRQNVPSFVAWLIGKGSQRFAGTKPELSVQSLSHSAEVSKASADTNSQESGVKSLEARMQDAIKFRPDRVPCGRQILRMNGQAVCVACDVSHYINI